MLLRKLEDRSTGRRVSGGGGGGASGGNDGDVGSAFPLASSSSPPPTPTSPRPPPPSRLASSLAASADLAPRLRVVATYDGHVGCVNAVSFAGERAERLVTGGDDMTVRIWASDVSAWEGGAPTTSTSTSTSPPLPSRRELARIRTQHRSNVFQAFFVDAGDEGSDLLTCAADGAVRSLSVPRAQCDRLFPRSSSSSARGCDGSGAAGGSATVVESRCLFKHCGRAHKMALVPGSPHEFATCGEDGVVATFDLRERGRGGGRGIGRGSGGGSSSPSPLTAAVGPAALAAAARVPGRSCFPPSDRGCSRAQPASSSAINVNVTLYSVSFDSQRPWLLAVGGDANELGLGELPAALVIDRRMLSIPPSEAFNRFDDDDESGSGTDPTAGTIFARGSLFRELLDSSSMAGRMALGTLDEARLPSKCAAVVQGSALPAHLGTFRCCVGTKASRSARRHARFRARGASVTGVAFEPRGRGSLLVTVNAESAVYLVPAAVARGEACAGDAEEDADSDVGRGGRGGGGGGSSSESEDGSSGSEEGGEEGGGGESSDGEGGTERDRRRRRRQQQQRERERRERQRQQRQQRRRNRDPAPPPLPREPRPSRSYFHRREDNDDNEHADPDGCRRFSGSGYRNEATIKAAGFVGAESELVAAGGDGGRLFLFDARSSRLRARVRTDSHTCNAFRENPFAPLHLATVGIDDSVKLLAPVGERSGSGGRRGGRGGGGAGEEGGEGGGEGGGGRDSSGSGDEEGEENGNSEGEGDSGEEEGEEELAARLSVEGLESSSLRLMMRLAAMGALPTRRMSLAREVVGQEEGEQEEEEEE